MNYIEVKSERHPTPVKICYDDVGSGQPVVLIHGWPLSKEMWEYQIGPLVDAGFRVITYDRRGFGMSSRPYENYDYDTLADDLKALLDQLDVQHATLVGFSMGGGEIARYFSRHQGERVSRVVLISSVLPYMLKTDTNPDGVAEGMFDEMTDKIKQDRIAFLDDFGKTFFGVSMLQKPISTPLLEYFTMLCSTASPKATLECMHSFAFTDFRDELDSIDVPTLIIHGSADKTVPIDPTGKHAAKMITESHLIIYEDAPHGLFITDKDRLNEDLIEFIKEPITATVY